MSYLENNEYYMVFKKKAFSDKQGSFVDCYYESCIFQDCVFEKIDFDQIDIISAIFTHCRFEECSFEESSLYVFYGCNFIDCNFEGTFKANLSNCGFDDKAHLPYIPFTCPIEGEFIGWKVCRGQNNSMPYLVKLRIPDGVQRTSGFGTRKCRCEGALVLDILNIDGTPAEETAVVSHYDRTFIYTKGQWVRPKIYNSNRQFICAGGIHFFMEPQEAINYYESEWV